MHRKSRVVLALAALPIGPERWAYYEAACAEFSAKVINKKFADLERKGYINSGVTTRCGWLTDKGKAALNGIR